MTITTTADIATQHEEAAAEVARISALILEGSPDVTAADLVAAEAAERHAAEVLERQRELDRAAAQRAAAQEAAEAAQALREQLVATIAEGDGFAAEIDQKIAAASAALVDLWALAEARTEQADAARGAIAALARRTDVSAAGLRTVDGSFSRMVEVADVGRIGTVEPWTVVAAAVMATIEERTALSQGGNQVNAWLSKLIAELRPLAGRARQTLAEQS
jgi:hypothetical protein